MNAENDVLDNAVRLEVADQKGRITGGRVGWLERVLILGYAVLIVLVIHSTRSHPVGQTDQRTRLFSTQHILDDLGSK